MNTLDLRGVSCPLNFVKAKLALEPLPAGSEIEILLDDGDPIRNVPRSLADEGNQVLELTPAGDGVFRLRVRKGQP